MLAIIFKEIRESAVVAMLILIALGALIVVVIAQMQTTETPLVSDALHLVTAFGFPLAGFVLGMQQIMIDRRRGRWDFVIHRPISLTRIFFAKVIGGVAVYMTVCLIPLAGVVGWVATPGHIAAPFDWHMILPRMADLGSGLVWYVAGLLAAGRKARWFGSRLMPAGMAIVVSIPAFWLVTDLWQALAIFAGAIGILLPAAWGAFVFGGEYEPQPFVIRMLQGISVGPGVILAVLIALGILGEILDAAFGGMTHTLYSSMYQIDSNGRVAYSSIGPDGKQVLTDLKGNRLSDAEAKKFVQSDRTYTGELWLKGYENDNIELTGLQFKTRYCSQLGYSDSINWMYVANRRTIEGFNFLTRRYIGGIGPEGFVAAPALPEPFPEPLIKRDRSSDIVASRTTAYQINFVERQITRLLVTTDADPILDAGPVRSGLTRWDAYNLDYLVATRSSVFVFEKGQELIHVPLEYKYPPYMSLTVSWAGAKRYFFHYGNGDLNGDPRINDWLVETDERGNILNRTELPFPPPEITHQTGWVDALETIAVPPCVGWAKLMFAVWRENPHTMRYLVTNITVGMICAGIMMVLLRRYDQTRGTKIVWIVIAMLMGFCGILLLLSLRTRVAAVRCPNCSKARLVTRETCKHCEAPFPGPTMQGIEIFELV